MMAKIVRTPTRAEGGITPEEKARMDEHAKKWIANAFRTDPINPDKIVPAIEGLYAGAGLKKPRVVIVPSPLVMAFAFGASAAILYARKSSATRSATDSATLSATDSATYSATDSATRSATRSATLSATYSATDSATRSATRSATLSATDSATYSATDSATRSATRSATLSATLSATDSATYSATYSATDSATRSATYSATQAEGQRKFENGAAAACFELAGEFGIMCASRWYSAYQGGNMWSAYDCYLTAARDILGLNLPPHAKYAHWEEAAREGGFRVMHEDFCMVSDFPEFIKVDGQNLPHCEDGPSHRWRDGWSLYHWHGVAIPAEWIEQRKTIDPAKILKATNTEQRAAGAAILGARMLDVLDTKIIDSDTDPDHGDLIEMSLPGLDQPGRFLRAYCKRNGLIFEGVPYVSDIDGKPINTVRAAQAWSFGKSEDEFNYPDFVS